MEPILQGCGEKHINLSNVARCIEKRQRWLQMTDISTADITEALALWLRGGLDIYACIAITK